MKSPKNWTQLNDRLLQQTLFFELRSKRMRSPRNDYEGDFYYIQVGDWVNIVPVTADKHVVMVEQYRFGISSPSLELPGGMLDRTGPPKSDSPMENPEAAALRELEEETGYRGTDAVSLGFIHPNPALQTNCNYFFACHNVEKVRDQELDDAEDITVHLVPLAEIPSLIEHHRITHALVVSAFYRYFAQFGFPYS